MAYTAYTPNAATSSLPTDDIDLPDDTEMETSGIGAVASPLEEIADRVARLLNGNNTFGGEVTFADNVTMQADLDVDQDATVGGTLDVTGAITGADITGEIVAGTSMQITEQSVSVVDITLNGTSVHTVAPDISLGHITYHLIKSSDIAHEVEIRLAGENVVIGGCYRIGLAYDGTVGAITTTTTVYLGVTGSTIIVRPDSASDGEAIVFPSHAGGASSKYAFFDIFVFDSGSGAGNKVAVGAGTTPA